MEHEMRAGRAEHRPLGLVVHNLLFTAVIPGTGGGYLPWWILSRNDASVTDTAGYAVAAGAVIAAGAALYVRCLWIFAAVGGGTPGPWDPPRRLIALGPFRRVRNPIYVAAMLVILGEAWLFRSLPLLEYAAGAAVCCHLLVVWYEEPRLRRAFGAAYAEYTRTVPRWGVRPPRRRSR